ncbi:MAG: beta-ketoacyl-ACP synthase II [Fimbriiglobus sp.]
MKRRVVVTGLGTVNPIALNVPEYLRSLREGKNGIAPITLVDCSTYKVKFGGEVKNFTTDGVLDVKEARRLDRVSQFAVVGASQAIQDSGIDIASIDPFRFGVIMGTGIGGLSEFEDGFSTLTTKGASRVSPFTIVKMISNTSAGFISIKYGLRGPNTTVSTACSSAAHAIADAAATIADGRADAMITGGTEAAITPMGVVGFIACRALSERNDSPATASRPWDKDRDGFVLSEGAGIIVLEEYERAKARNAPIYAEILGCGNTADAFHITAPHEDGIGAAEAMKQALQQAKWNPTDVDYINAHGTSTPLGDVAETKAIKRIFGDHAHKLQISSTKSLLGHLLGASGGVEAIACCLMLKHGFLHPTINLVNQDREAGCDLDYVPNTARDAQPRRILSNSFGFGGHNCSLALASV